MCLGVPGRIVSVQDLVATVDFWGVRREVRLDIVDEPVAPGDYAWRLLSSQGMKAEYLLSLGTSVGIEFVFDRIARTPNTFDAHRLIWLAQQQGRQDEVVEELFHGYFTEGLNIGQPEILVSLAVRAGLDGEAVVRLLHAQEGVDAVRQEEAHGHQLGIRGVPYFVLNGKAALSGAQPVETFVSAIKQVTG
mgnify:CR=1 FL=1